MDTFKYDSINLDNPTFRLLRLCQGRGLDIECEIFQASFDDFDLVDYEALSYTWGSQSVTQAIHVNGHTLQVTRNLYSALKYLRFPTIDRILWVDAICIDQENYDERGHQIRQMGSIYSKAVKVIFWLGLENDDTNILMDSLKHLERSSLRYACKSWPPGDSRWNRLWSSLSHEPTYQHLHRPSQQHAGLSQLLERPWFKRVWILQEVANAKKAVICCGHKSVSARIFAIAPPLLGVQPEVHCQAVLDIMPGIAAEGSWWHQNRNLYNLLQKFQGSEATDPRDMVYALLGIASDGDHLLADYKKDIKAVIQDTGLFLFGLSDCGYTTMPVFLQSFLPLNTASLNDIATSGDENQILHLLRERGHLMEITAAAITAAAKNVNYGEQVAKLLLRLMNPNELLVETVAFEMAAENTGCGVEVTRLLLEYKGNPNFWMTTAIAEKAARNSKHALGLSKLLITPGTSSCWYNPIVLEAIASNIKDGPEIMRHLIQQRDSWIWNDAAMCRREVLMLLIQVKGQDAIPHEVVTSAASNKQHGPEVLELLLEQPNFDFEIADKIIISATTNGESGDKVLQLLLERRAEKFQITKSTIEVMAERSDSSTMEMLLEKRGHDVIVTEKVIFAAARNCKDCDAMMKVLLDHDAGRFAINSQVVKHIVRWTGPPTIAHLLKQRGNDVEVNEEIVEAAGRNVKHGEGVIMVLIQHGAKRIKITPKLIGLLAVIPDPAPMSHLLKTSSERHVISEEMLEVASAQAVHGAATLSVLLKHCEGKVRITENILRKAACNPFCGEKLIDWIIQMRPNEIKVTSETLEVVASCVDSRQGVMKSLLQICEKDVCITKTVMEAAAGNNVHAKYLMRLFLESQKEFLVTDSVVKAALRSGPIGRGALELLLRKAPTKFEITETTLIDFANYEHPRLIRLTLQQRGDAVMVTENLMEAAAKNAVYGETIVELLEAHEKLKTTSQRKGGEI